MAPIKVLRPLNDVCFKKIFSDTEVLKDFINAVTRRQQDDMVTNITPLRTELREEDFAVEVLFRDLLCQAINGDKFLIEVQVWRHEGCLKQVQCYASRVLSKQLSRGGDYNDLRPVTVIVLCCFDALKNRKPFSFHCTKDEQSNCYLKLIQYVFLQIPCFVTDNVDIANLSPENLWLYFFARGESTDCLNDDEVTKIKLRNELLYKAIQSANKANWDDNQKRAYERVEKALMDYSAGIATARSEGYSKGYSEGYSEGYSKGYSEGRRDLVRRMLANGSTKDAMKSNCRLSDEEINLYTNDLVPRDS